MSQATKERILNVLIVLAAIALAAVIVYPQYQMAQPTKVKILVDRSLLSLPVFIADEKGLFKKNKVETEIVFANDPDERQKALLQNECELTYLPWLLVLKEPHPYKVIASVESRILKPVESLLTVPKSRIKRIRDLRGKKIGVMRAHEVYLDNLLTHLPKTVKGSKKVYIEPDEIEMVIRDRKVDALFLLEPYRTVAIGAGAKVFQDAPLSYFIQRGYPVAAYCISNQLLTKNRIGARRIRDGLNGAIREILKDRDEAKRILFARMDLTGEFLSTKVAEFQRLREINDEALKSFVQKFNLTVDPESAIANPIIFER